MASAKFRPNPFDFDAPSGNWQQSVRVGALTALANRDTFEADMTPRDYRALADEGDDSGRGSVTPQLCSLSVTRAVMSVVSIF